jgi:putative transposase
MLRGSGPFSDPKDYRFCGYSEAVAGSTVGQDGLADVGGHTAWQSAQSSYREILFGTGGGTRAMAASIPASEVQRVLVEGGRLSLASILRCRIRYFTDGGVLGSRAFVDEQIAAYRRKTGGRALSGSYLLPACTEWGELAALRGLRRRAIG